MPTELQGRSSHQERNNDHRRQSTAITADLQGGNGSDSTQQAKDKVTKLQEELRAAKLEVSLAENTVTTNVLHGSQGTLSLTTEDHDPKALSQGPIVKTEIYLEGHPAVALIDTGSPISIVSIDFLLQTLNQSWPKSTSKEDWMSSVRDQLKPPSMTARIFGGGEVNVICQCTVNLIWGPHKCDATVLVQKGIAQKILLGTDMLKKLRMCMLTPEVKEEAKNLLGSGDWQLQSVGKDPKLKPIPAEQVATIHLLQTCRIPARHCRLAPVEASSRAKGEMTLFCPNKELRESGATPAVCVTSLGDDGKAVLSIKNHLMHPVTLEQEEVLGILEIVREVTTAGAVNTIKTKQGSQKPSMEPEERMNQLFLELNMEESLSEQKLDQLKAVVSSFSDGFAGPALAILGP